MVAVVGLAAWLMIDFRSDLEYFLSEREPIELGNAADVGRKDKVDYPTNRHARVTGVPNVNQVSKSTVWGVSRNFFPLMGSGNRVFISVVRQEDPDDPNRKRGFIPRRPYQGRLVSLHLAEYAKLREYYIETFKIRFPENCYLLIDDSRPEDKYPYAILYVFLIGLVGLNLFTFVRYIVWKAR
jgi:hypothetical protein